MADQHLTIDDLEAGLGEIRQSPRDRGVLRLIVRRPKANAREVLEEAIWIRSRARRTPGKSAETGASGQSAQHHECARDCARGAVARSLALAGDQLFIDLDLSADNLPPGTRVALGSAVIEVTEEPHTGCSKFAARFGIDAKFVNSPEGNSCGSAASTRRS